MTQQVPEAVVPEPEDVTPAWLPSALRRTGVISQD
jgi:hypothetical protein